MAMLSWHVVTSTDYNAADASQKTSDKIYFLSDTKQIYKGTELFTQAYSLVDEDPVTPAVGIIYINNSTLEAKVWDGANWKVVIDPVTEKKYVDDQDRATLESAKEYADQVETDAKAYTDQKVGAHTTAVTELFEDYAKSTDVDTAIDAITVTGIELGDPVDGVQALQLIGLNGAKIGNAINLDLERFVQSGEYNADTKKITLYFDAEKTEKVEIDAAALVDVYTGGDRTTAKVTVTGNEIFVDVKVSSTAGNQLTINDDGLFIAATDLTDYATKEYADQVETDAKAYTDQKVGAHTTAVAELLESYATDAEVEAIRSALQTAIDGKTTLQAVKDYVDPALTQLRTDVDSKTTMDAVESYVEGYAVAKTEVVSSIDAARSSETKVASENAIVEALTWKTTI